MCCSRNSELCATETATDEQDEKQRTRLLSGILNRGIDEVTYVSKGRKSTGQNETITCTCKQLVNGLSALIFQSKSLPSFSLSYSILSEPELHYLEKRERNHFNKSSDLRKKICIWKQLPVS